MSRIIFVIYLVAGAVVDAIVILFLWLSFIFAVFIKWVAGLDAKIIGSVVAAMIVLWFILRLNRGGNK